MTYLDDILSTDLLASVTYRVLPDGRIVFDSDMTGKTVEAVCLIEPELTLDNLNSRYELAALYWVLFRWHQDTNTGLAGNYYDLYSLEWANVSHNRTRLTRQGLGTDL
jgi:hypothetical protein